MSKKKNVQYIAYEDYSPSFQMLIDIAAILKNSSITERTFIEDFWEFANSLNIRWMGVQKSVFPLETLRQYKNEIKSSDRKMQPDKRIIDSYLKQKKIGFEKTNIFDSKGNIWLTAILQWCIPELQPNLRSWICEENEESLKLENYGFSLTDLKNNEDYRTKVMHFFGLQRLKSTNYLDQEKLKNVLLKFKNCKKKYFDNHVIESSIDLIKKFASSKNWTKKSTSQKNYVERNQYLEKIKSIFSITDPKGIAFDGRVCILHGAPGMGKSVLAENYQNLWKSSGGKSYWCSLKGKDIEEAKQILVREMNEAPLNGLVISKLLESPKGKEDYHRRIFGELKANKVLIVFDDMDTNIESGSVLNEEPKFKSFLENIGKIPCVFFLITTRTMIKHFSPNCHIEVKGFDNEDTFKLYHGLLNEEISQSYRAYEIWRYCEIEKINENIAGCPLLLRVALSLLVEKERNFESVKEFASSNIMKNLSKEKDFTNFFELSLENISGKQKEIFRALGACAKDGTTIDILELMESNNKLEERLQSLIHRGLVQQSKDRYLLHPLFYYCNHIYLCNHLPEKEYYSKKHTDAWRQLLDKHELLEKHPQFSSLLEDLMLAFDQLRNQKDASTILDFCDKVYLSVLRRGTLTQVRKLVDEAFKIAFENKCSKDIGKWAKRLGSVYRELDIIREGKSHISKAEHFLRSDENANEEYFQLKIALLQPEYLDYLESNDLTRKIAQEHLQLIKEAKELNKIEWVYECLRRTAWNCHNEGRMRLSESLFSMILQLEDKSSKKTSITELNLASAFILRGETERGKELLEKVKEFRQTHHRENGMSFVHGTKTILFLNQGHYKKAMKESELALSVSRRIEASKRLIERELRHINIELEILSQTKQKSSINYDSLSKAKEKLEEIKQEIHDKHSLLNNAQVRRHLAIAAWLEDKIDEALEYLNEAESFVINYPNYLAQIQLFKSKILWEKNDHKAYGFVLQAISLSFRAQIVDPNFSIDGAQDVSFRWTFAQALIHLGNICRDDSNPIRAIAFWKQAQEELHRLQHQSYEQVSRQIKKLESEMPNSQIATIQNWVSYYDELIKVNHEKLPNVQLEQIFSEEDILFLRELVESIKLP